MIKLIEIISLLLEAKNQLEYLNQKFPETGTTNSLLSRLETAAEKLAKGFFGDIVSDGYHTFNELYEFRKMYNAALFNEWAARGMYKVHKSKKHHDGQECFDGGWFIVCANLPSGQISNHYKLEDWDLFKCQAVEKALFEFDGHTPKDVLERLTKLEYLSEKNKIVETYIVHDTDTEIYKIHLLANGNYYKEYSKGGLSIMNKNIAEKLINA